MITWCLRLFKALRLFGDGRSTGRDHMVSEASQGSPSVRGWKEHGLEKVKAEMLAATENWSQTEL